MPGRNISITPAGSRPSQRSDWTLNSIPLELAQQVKPFPGTTSIPVLRNPFYLKITNGARKGKPEQIAGEIVLPAVSYQLITTSGMRIQDPSGCAQKLLKNNLMKKQRIRISFSKTEAMRFTGHLDLILTWERTFRRADLPLSYSEGFNPRPVINLAAPLPLGFISTAEIGDFWLSET